MNGDVSEQLLRIRGWLLRLVQAMVGGWSVGEGGGWVGGLVSG